MIASSKVHWLCSTLVWFAFLFTWCPSGIGQESGGGGDDPPPQSSARFPFEQYDYFRMEVANDGGLQLVSIDRHDLGLYTPTEHFQQTLNLGSAAWSALAGDYWTAWGQISDAGQWLSAFTVTLGSQGQGIVMVKKQSDDDETSANSDNPLDEIIIVISGFEPWGNHTDNNSTAVAEVVHDKLKGMGIATDKVIIDVIWGEPNKKIDEIVTKTKLKHPDKKIIWIGLGIGDGFKLETVGKNEQGQIEDDAGITPPAGSVNEPGGGAPPTSGPCYDPDTVISTLDSHGVTMVASTDAGKFLCDALTFKLHRMAEQGLIDVGIFIHVPQVTDGAINDKFANGMAEVVKQWAQELTTGNEEDEDEDEDVDNEGGVANTGGTQEPQNVYRNF